MKSKEEGNPRILVYSASYSTDNGQGVFTVNLCERLAKRNVPVAAIISSPDGHYCEELRNSVFLYQLKSTPVPWIRKGDYYTFFPSNSIKKVFDDFKPDVVHINDHYPLSFYVYKEAKKRGIRVVGTNHFMPLNLAPFIPGYAIAPEILSWVLWNWMLKIYNKLELVTSQSRAAGVILKQNGLVPPVETISCGVDTSFYYPLSDFDRIAFRRKYGLAEERTVFLYIGRLDGEKRLESTIEAISQNEQDDIQLVLAGKGKKITLLKSLAKEKCRPGQVVFPGYIPDSDKNELYNCVDCFIMPSDAELLSIATLEAMASGLPVLAARAYALPELVNPGENGYLFSPRSITDILHKMTLFCENKQGWSDMKIASIARAKKHDIELAISRYISIFRSSQKEQQKNKYRLLQSGKTTVH
ncbi:MAG: glycosyltransferase [Anaerolineaceae bacterium]|nr:glycosyltransferase [Anaerolineaceae bacterium]